MAVFQHSVAQPAADDEVVTKSCRFDGASYLGRTPASAGNLKKNTWSFWVKRGELGTASNGLWGTPSDTAVTYCIFTSTDELQVTMYNTTGAYYFQYKTTQKFRDPAAWYHIVISYDATLATTATDADRFGLWINGEMPTSWVYNVLPSVAETLDYDWGSTVSNRIGQGSGGSYNGEHYIADFYSLDGVGPTDSAFSGLTNPSHAFAKTDTNGQWVPIAYGGTYGTTGFHLDFKDGAATSGSNAGLGKDVSGNGNYFDTTGLAASDQMNDRPTNNYSVLNPLDSYTTLSEGNLKWVQGSGVGYLAFSTVAINNIAATQKYYAEFIVDAGYAVGIAPDTKSGVGSATYSSGGIKAYYSSNGNKYADNSGSAYGATFGTSNVIGVLVGDGTLEFFKDDVSQGDAYTGLTGTYKFAAWAAGGVGSGVKANFGGDPTFQGAKSGEATSEFFYTPEAGALALSTANLPTPTIAKGNEHFDTLLYTGNTETTSRNITGLSFQPDLVWLKARTFGGWHRLVDSVRAGLGTDTGGTMFPNDASGEGAASYADSGYIGAFLSGSAESPTGGITLTEGTLEDFTNVNYDTITYAAWNWKGGSTGESGTAGGWAEDYNSDAGFSIVKWSGDDVSLDYSTSQTIHHTLGYAPDFIIAKPRSSDYGGYGNWVVYHKDLPANKFLLLNSSNAQFDGDGGNGLNIINNIGSTSIGVANDTSLETLNLDGDTYIAYLFNEVAGYSKFGTYVGNLSADGPFVWCGFRPAYLIIKRSTSSSEWNIQDTARDPYNVQERELKANSPAIEATGSARYIDFLSNGFKIRTNDADHNTGTIIFAAFAEKPFKYAAAR